MILRVKVLFVTRCFCSVFDMLNLLSLIFLAILSHSSQTTPQLCFESKFHDSFPRKKQIKTFSLASFLPFPLQIIVFIHWNGTNSSITLWLYYSIYFQRDIFVHFHSMKNNQITSFEGKARGWKIWISFSIENNQKMLFNVVYRLRWFIDMSISELFMTNEIKQEF